MADWLDAHRPARFRPGVIHGDYQPANVLYRFDGPQLAAIVDWELTTVGDPARPRLDHGHLAAGGPSGVREAYGDAVEGFPTIDELGESYAARPPWI